MTEPNDSQPDSIESQLQKINLETAMAQLQKLNLEIEDLRAERNWEERIARFIPIITAVISIAGFLWGVVLFRNQQEKDRITREADQISRDMNQYRTSYEQLLQFSSNQNMSVARVLSLRQDLDALIDSLYPAEKNPKENQIQKDRLRASIYDLISKDFDFTQTRQVQFDIAALQNWPDYKKGLEGTLNVSIIERYLQALGDLRYKNPGVFEQIRVNDSDEYQEPDTLIGNPYRSVIEGFVCHLDCLSDDQKMAEIKKFGGVTENKLLAAQLFIFKCPAVAPPPKNSSN